MATSRFQDLKIALKAFDGGRFGDKSVTIPQVSEKSLEFTPTLIENVEGFGVSTLDAQDADEVPPGFGPKGSGCFQDESQQGFGGLQRTATLLDPRLLETGRCQHRRIAGDRRPIAKCFQLAAKCNRASTPLKSRFVPFRTSCEEFRKEGVGLGVFMGVEQTRRLVESLQGEATGSSNGQDGRKSDEDRDDKATEEKHPFSVHRTTKGAVGDERRLGDRTNEKLDDPSPFTGRRVVWGLKRGQDQ